MKRIGLVGGMTPESTKLYYDRLIELGRETLEGTLANPVVIIYSINLAVVADLERTGRPDRVVDLLAGVIESLRLAGAEIGALTANTPHIYYDRITARTSLPLISILDSTLEKARKLGSKRPLLLGTDKTMDSPMYPERFQAGGMRVLLPEEAERQLINRSIYDELSVGTVTAQTREAYLRICRFHIEQNRADAVILGCTEIPLVLADGDLPVPLIDTARTHAEAIFAAAKG